MNQLLRFGLILGVICLLATLVLAVTFEITRPKIEEQQNAEEQSALKDILREADSFIPGSAGDIAYFEALKNGKLVGYCVKVTGSGYGGFIRMIVGIDPNGIIKGVGILEHQETPGLGARINELRPGEKEPWFLRQFKGKGAENITVKKNIDSITGATISSRAVTDAIKTTISEFLSRVRK